MLKEQPLVEDASAMLGTVHVRESMLLEISGGVKYREVVCILLFARWGEAARLFRTAALS